MKWLLIIIVIIGLIYFSSDSAKNINPYESEDSKVNVVNSSLVKQISKEDCQSPSNPYDEGSGHYAGFEWKAENGYECGGNSDSFIEGCQEYVRQLNSYNICIKQN